MTFDTLLVGEIQMSTESKPVTPKEIFLAYFFSGEGYAEDSDTGLQISISGDGCEFYNISENNEPLYIPRKGKLRDPYIIFKDGYWIMVHSYGENISPILFLLKSKDLKNWTPMCSLRLEKDIPGGNNIIDVPTWVIDPNGHVHIIACLDHNHHWVEIHPLSDDPETWGDENNWSSVTEMTDINGDVLIQGNSYVDVKDGVFYMGFNDIKSINIHMRSSKSLVSGWSLPRVLSPKYEQNCFDSVSFIFLFDGTLRYNISCGNSLQYKQWYIYSNDLGMTWSEPVYIKHHGFNHRINWAEIACIKDPDAIKSLSDAGLLRLII